jgi:heptosyltransferase II
MKILCICPIGIGNYLMAYPSFRLLRAADKGHELHLLALRQSIATLAKNDPLWDKTHVIDPTEKNALRKLGALVRELTRERFDASLSFFPSNNWQYNLLPFLCSIPLRFAFEYPLKKGASLSFLNNHSAAMDPRLHDVEQNKLLVASFTGGSVPPSPLVFPELSSEQAMADAQQFLDKAGGPALYIGVHPGSSSEHGMLAKRWDPMRFGELATRICNVLKGQTLIFGSSDEEKVKHVTASIMKAPRQIVPPMNLQTTAALLRRCTLLLCNDSGLMHMAACMGVPTVAVFGPTDERRNGPMGAGHLVLRKAMDGFPVWTAANVGVRSVKSSVDPQASLRALSVDDAWEKVMPWIMGFKERPGAAKGDIVRL